MTELLNRFIDHAQNLEVLVIGETISDVFIKVKYEGHSMKSFCPVFQVDATSGPELQEGGALAIANHLRDFVGHLDLVSNPPESITKTRYLDVNNGQKHVEINQFKVEGHSDAIDYDNYDVIILADFGHGFCDELDLPDGIHVMCQTNSNNFGFNRVSKWKHVRKSSICIDLREASLQMNRKVSLASVDELKELYAYELNTDDLYVTKGRSGVIFTDGTRIEEYPSFKTEIVDTIGAGDAFFAFACLMSHLKWTPYERLALPSLAASLTTTWLANEGHINKANLTKHAKNYL